MAKITFSIVTVSLGCFPSLPEMPNLYNGIEYVQPQVLNMGDHTFISYDYQNLLHHCKRAHLLRKT